MKSGRLAVAVFLLLGCNQGPVSQPSHVSASPSAGAIGCGSTAIETGPIPKWIDDAGAHNNPSFLPYVIASPAKAAGFLFAFPLRAGHPTDPANKILWVVGKPRNGFALEVSAHPLGAANPTIDQYFPANSGPGEIYPSIVDVPRAGCWHIDLKWNANEAAVDLGYV